MPAVSLGAWETLRGYRAADVARDAALGVSNYRGAQFAEAVRITDKLRLAPLTITQPRYYNLLERWAEWDLLPHTRQPGSGVIAYSPLAQGVLTDKYLHVEVPPGSRAAELRGADWLAGQLTDQRRRSLRALSELARRRGQTLAQMALAWTLRLPEITSVLMGASRTELVEENVAAVRNLSFTDDDLAEIDRLL